MILGSDVSQTTELGVRGLVPVIPDVANESHVDDFPPTACEPGFYFRH